ncbi:hypothetical protein [Streptomyces sp. NPDC001970]
MAPKSTGPGRRGANHGPGGLAGEFARTVTAGVLRASAYGPAGSARAARDNMNDHYKGDDAPISA